MYNVYIASCPTHTKRSDIDHTVLPAKYTVRAFCFASVNQMAAPRHVIGAYYSFIDLERVKG